MKVNNRMPLALRYAKIQSEARNGDKPKADQPGGIEWAIKHERFNVMTVRLEIVGDADDYTIENTAHCSHFGTYEMNGVRVIESSPMDSVYIDMCRGAIFGNLTDEQQREELNKRIEATITIEKMASIFENDSYLSLVNVEDAKVIGEILGKYTLYLENYHRANPHGGTMPVETELPRYQALLTAIDHVRNNIRDPKASSNIGELLSRGRLKTLSTNNRVASVQGQEPSAFLGHGHGQAQAGGKRSDRVRIPNTRMPKVSGYNGGGYGYSK